MEDDLALFASSRTSQTAERAPNPATVCERRVAFEERRRVAEMSPEEMRRELLTSEVTGLPNRRAFDEAGRSPAVAMCDVDGLKALNRYGYDVGNAVLKATAAVLREAGLEAYHDKGDEFLCRGNSVEELRDKLERARTMLWNRTALAERPNGNSLCITGAGFSYGVGTYINEAERALRNHKAGRESAGEIVRGELRGISLRIDNSGIPISTVGARTNGCLDSF
jgi:GGDEF domain-containing protein